MSENEKKTNDQIYTSWSLGRNGTFGQKRKLWVLEKVEPKPTYIFPMSIVSTFVHGKFLVYQDVDLIDTSIIIQ